MKHRILFVDDEQPVLDGLRALLRSQRKQWDMHFAVSSREALALMAEEPFDMVVSDMRMPGMDGEALLKRVRDRWPDTLRVILSGYADATLIMRTVLTAHQFLAKPCEPEALTATLERTLSLRDVLTDRHVRTRISRVGSLPAMRQVYLDILAELNRSDPSLGRLGELAEQDPGVSASLLKLVNSAFFGLFAQMTSPARAVALLGLDTLHGLVISLHLFENLKAGGTTGYSLERLGDHCRRTGLLARSLAMLEKLPREQVDRCFLSGLLHDVGKLLLVQELWDEYRPIIAAMPKAGRPLAEVERDVMGLTHAEIGAYLIGVWSMDKTVVRAVLAHHDPSRDSEPGFSPALAAHVANALEHEFVRFQGHAEYTFNRLDEAALAARGFSGRLAVWRAHAKELIANGAE